MAETFKQLKRSEDSIETADVTGASKKIQKTVRAFGKLDAEEGKGENNQDQDAVMMEEDQAIKDRTEKKQGGK
jgi:hypothetical protein